MLTPAEEMGLSGMNLAGRVRKAFYSVPQAELAALVARLREDGMRRRVVYLRDGRPEVIHVLPCPLTVLPDQLSYLHYVSLTIHNALKRLPELYLQDFAVRQVLQLTPDEERWLWECWGPSHQENNPIFGRLDAVVDFCNPMWKDSLKFVEPNLSGIGGLHLVPTCEALLAEHVFPLLQARDGQLRLEVGQDIRELLTQDILDHLEAIGRKASHLCFIEPKYAASGIDEQEALAEYFRTRYGMQVMHADPSELTLRGDDVYYEDQRIDVAYRDYAVLDLFAERAHGIDIEPMRVLFRQNRVVSSIGAELDQKSCFEIFTDRQFVQKYFGPEERQVFRRHVLWTRILSARSTQLPDGQQGDLLEYARDERESLVLKPNRACGGEGVLIGLAVTQAEWETAIDRALADSQRWVVQQRAMIPVYEFPIVRDDGTLHPEPFYTVMGFAATKFGLAMLARASQKQVVNVAQRGGMCAVAIGHAPGRLLGPTSARPGTP